MRRTDLLGVFFPMKEGGGDCNQILTTATASADSTSATLRVEWKAMMVRVYTTVTKMHEIKMARGRFLHIDEDDSVVVRLC